MRKFHISKENIQLVIEKGHYNVDMGGWHLNFYYKPGSVKKAFIFSPGYIDREKFPFPYFQRIKWLDNYDCMGISLADPTLELEEGLELGWFLGTIKCNYSHHIADFISKLLIHLDIKNSQTLFFGSSAGGFSSLVFSGLIKGSCAFVVNPQTNILKFHDVNVLSKVSRICFEGITGIGLEKNWKDRLCISELYKKNRLYPENSNLAKHSRLLSLQKSFTPFLNGNRKNNNKK